MNSVWQLQEAKNKLSELINQAVLSRPQVITKHGKQTAVILSIKDYQKLKEKKNSLVTFLQKSPLRGVSLERSKDVPREVEL